MPEVNDTARGLPMTPATALAAIMSRKPGEPAPMACCPSPRCNDDGPTPLVMTFCTPGAEFYCMTCGGWFGFLAPTPVAVTPELTEIELGLRARFDAGERAPT